MKYVEGSIYNQFYSPKEKKLYVFFGNYLHIIVQTTLTH